jgi:small conductance mechanosensitive channel
MPTVFTHWVDRTLEWLLTSGVRILAVALAMFLVLALIRRATSRFHHALRGGAPDAPRVRRAETLSNVVRDVLGVLVWVVGGLMVLSELGLDLKPLLAAAGIGGLAIGFGAQSLVKDVISGFFVLLEDQIRVGDVVEVSGVSGVVEEIRLRTLSLRDGAGALHVVPHGAVEKVKNMTRGHAYAVLEVAVSYREDVESVIAAIEETAAALRADPAFAPHVTDAFETGGVDRFDDSGVLVTGRLRVHPGQQWRVARALRERVKKAFDAKGIEMAVARRALHLEEPRGREPTALRVVTSTTSS